MQSQNENSRLSSHKYAVVAPKRTKKPKLSGDGFVRKKKQKGISKKDVDNRPWLEKVKEINNWKKTEDYKKWRRKQYLKQAGTCYYCDTPFEGARSLVEHVRPKSKGGSNNKSNLVLSCWKCNKDKNTKILSGKELNTHRRNNKSKRNNYMNRLELESEIAQEIKRHI